MHISQHIMINFIAEGDDKMERLKSFFDEHRKIALAFSGGTDSAFLLYAALYYKANVKAYFIKSQFQPNFEIEDAKSLARELNVDLTIIEVDILSFEDVRRNPNDRCYYCKKHLFSRILEEAKRDGFDTVIDGTNASDDISDRPGYKALQEMKVLSPLKLCGITKSEVRRLSKEAGLFTAAKPAYACLATRIESGKEITNEALIKTQESEAYLFSLGFSDFRVRNRGDNALLELREQDLELLMKNRVDIINTLKKKYKGVMLNLEVRG